jgi:hypothetical protein
MMNLRVRLFYLLMLVAGGICTTCQNNASRIAETKEGSTKLANSESCTLLGKVKSAHSDPRKCAIYELKGGFIVTTISGEEFEDFRICVLICRTPKEATRTTRDLCLYLSEKYEKSRASFDDSDTRKLRAMRSNILTIMLTFMTPQIDASDLTDPVEMLRALFKAIEDMMVESIAGALENAFDLEKGSIPEGRGFVTVEEIKEAWRRTLVHSTGTILICGPAENEELAKIAAVLADVSLSKGYAGKSLLVAKDAVNQQFNLSQFGIDLLKVSKDMSALSCCAVTLIDYNPSNLFEKNMVHLLLEKFKLDCDSELEHLKKKYSSPSCYVDVGVILDKAYFCLETWLGNYDRALAIDLMADLYRMVSGLMLDEGEFRRLKEDFESKFYALEPLSTEALLTAIQSNLFRYPPENLLNKGHCLDGVEFEHFAKMFNQFVAFDNWSFFYHSEDITADVRKQLSVALDS